MAFRSMLAAALIALLVPGDALAQLAQPPGSPASHPRPAPGGPPDRPGGGRPDRPGARPPGIPGGGAQRPPSFRPPHQRPPHQRPPHNRPPSHWSPNHRPPHHRPPQYRPPHHWPAYHYPHGYRYRRWGVGAVLPFALFTSAHYFTQWSSYDLPPPPPHFRWVRYGPDLLLVNTRTGAVRAVRYGFFA